MRAGPAGPTRARASLKKKEGRSRQKAPFIPRCLFAVFPCEEPVRHASELAPALALGPLGLVSIPADRLCSNRPRPEIGGYT